MAIPSLEHVVPKDEQFAVLVFTSETVETILSRGGTGDWVLSPKKAGTCKYIVCCRKAAWNNKKEGIAHRAAFLIGLIAGLHKQPGSENDRGQPRFLIELSEYAAFERAAVWKEARSRASTCEWSPDLEAASIEANARIGSMHRGSVISRPVRLSRLP